MGNNKKILEAFKNKKINKYMYDRLSQAVDDNVDEQLLDDAMADAEDATKLDINSDENYSARFVLNNVIDDILKDTFGVSLPDDKKNDLIRFILRHERKGEFFKDLVGLRLATYYWLRDRNVKRAYPNISGKYKRDPTYDTNKWTQSAKNLYYLMKVNEMDRGSALKSITKDWDQEEALRFDRWLNYYESGNTEKYNVKTSSLKTHAMLPNDMLNVVEEPRSNVSPSFMSAYRIKEQEEESKRNRANSISMTKRQMKSRLKSLWNLVHKFNDLLPKSSVDSILNLIHQLDISISKLQTEASIRDCIVRTANRIKREGFDQGADFLIKVSQEPLSESITEPTDPVSTPAAQKPRPNIQVSAIIAKLENLSKMLKSRDLIRNLSSIDILLNELGMASLFTELGDSQSKLNDAFGYASNKIEDVISKLRGSGKVKPLGAEDVKKPIGPAMSPSAVSAPAPLSSATPISPPPKVERQEEKMDVEEIRGAPLGQIKTELPK